MWFKSLFTGPKKRKTAVIVIPSLTLGGAEKQAVYYARSISRVGVYEPVIVGLGKDGQLREILDFHQIRYETYPSVFSDSHRLGKLWEIFRFTMFLRKLRPHLVMGFTYFPNILCGLSWPFTGASFFVWNQRSVDTHIPLTIWESLCMRFHPKYLANSKACATFISQRHQVQEESVMIIHNAIGNIPKTPSKDGLNNPNRPLNLLMIANFFPEKDYATVLRALALYREKHPEQDFIFHCIGTAPGTSPQEMLTKALAFDLKLEDRVKFHGTVVHPHEFLLEADIGILSTYSEGFSNSIMEYMVYGLPVAATSIPPNQEALGEDYPLGFFNPNDAHGLASILETLMNNPKLRQELGERNRQRVMHAHGFEKFHSLRRSLFITFERKPF
jgi:glycosyltransferase involved in cell wall biosynthesis